MIIKKVAGKIRSKSVAFDSEVSRQYFDLLQLVNYEPNYI
jgi:hypothetical protein